MAVKTQQVVNQLTREIKRNPAKAAVLGGLLVVAVWFWFPLIQRWLGPSNVASAKPTDESIVVSPTSSPVATTASPASTTSWKSTVKQIRNDPWMKAGTLRSETFDPFYPEQPLDTQLTSIETAPEATLVPDVSPETAGLAVTSVITGGRFSMARINKRNYHVGDEITLQGGQVTFTVVAIKNWGVLLQGQRRAYELHLEHSPLNPGHRMVMRNGTIIPDEN